MSATHTSLGISRVPMPNRASLLPLIGAFSPVTDRRQLSTGWRNKSGHTIETLLPVFTGSPVDSANYNQTVAAPIQGSSFKYTIGDLRLLAKLCPASSATGCFPVGIGLVTLIPCIGQPLKAVTPEVTRLSATPTGSISPGWWFLPSYAECPRSLRTSSIMGTLLQGGYQVL